MILFLLHFHCSEEVCPNNTKQNESIQKEMLYYYYISSSSSSTATPLRKDYWPGSVEILFYMYQNLGFTVSDGDGQGKNILRQRVPLFDCSRIA